ncbi:MAG: flavin oxidoreductase/NADH oxidase [Oscillospiraceae bacterium]|nr:flavin oxidoreductase/NADH oxidase [Oscillospiraceae bacterium]
MLLNTSYSVGGLTVPNRVVFQPMEGCDCEENGAPSQLTIQKYHAEAASGAGLIWFEACAVCPEGRTNPRQMMLTAENLEDFKRLVEQVREIAKAECGINPVLILQLTHSGRQSIVPMIGYRNAVYEEKRPLTDEHIVSDEYLDTLPGKYLASAHLAKEAGFDGVDIKSCHGYLFQEMLSAFSRPGKYGGSFENRARLYLDTLMLVNRELGNQLLIGSRLSVVDMVPKPWGFGTDEQNQIDMTEPLKLISLAQENGVKILNVTLGNPYYNPHVNRPFRKGGYTPPETAQVGLDRFAWVQKEIKDNFPTLCVLGSGMSYYREELIEKSEELLEKGVCDLVGYGRVSLAYPSFYRDFLDGKFDSKKCCVACSKCTELMRNKCVSGCAVFHPYYRQLYKEKVQK